MIADALFTLHFAATWYLVGLCWIVQRVQYPLMAEVGPEHFMPYEQGHVRRITPVVAPPMIVELVSGLALLFVWRDMAVDGRFLASMGLLALIWLSTFAVQVPLHDTLQRGFDAGAHARLVRTNWIRTVAWSARGLLLAWILLARGSGSG